MSGPIVRKYGFPNFEKIFGERPLLHGEPAVEEPTAPVESTTEAPAKAGNVKPAKENAPKPKRRAK